MRLESRHVAQKFAQRNGTSAIDIDNLSAIGLSARNVAIPSNGALFASPSRSNSMDWFASEANVF
jgi:hypothetical protein